MNEDSKHRILLKLTSSSPRPLAASDSLARGENRNRDGSSRFTALNARHATAMRTGLSNDGAGPEGTALPENGGLRNILLDAMLDLMRHSIVIVDHELEICWLNQAATRLLDEGVIVRRVGDRLRASDSVETARLKRAVRTTLNTREPIHVMIEPLRSSRTGRFCEVVACSAGNIDGCGNGGSLPAVILMITDPDQHTAVPDSILSTLFHLTPCERKLAGALLNGQSLDEHAIEFDISVSTARTHLKSIFRKTETSSQASLVTLLSRLVPPLDFELEGS